MKLAQSNVIFFALFVGFVIFITIRGDLPAYLNVVFKTQTPQPTTTGEPSAAGGSSSGSGVNLGSVLSSSNPVGTLATQLGAPSFFSNIGSGISSIGSSIGGLFGF